MISKLRSIKFVRDLVNDPRFMNNLFVRKLYEMRIKNKIKNRYPFPPGILIETLNICNSRCITCPYRKMKREKKIMSFKLYKKIIDEAMKYDVKRLQLNQTGEPLLDKLIFKRISYAKRNGLKGVRIFTNASLLDEKKAEKLIYSGIDLVIISMDGATKEIFESIRIGLDFDIVVNNTLNFLSLKKKLKVKTPKIEIHMTVTEKNKKEGELLIKKFKKLADSVTLTNAHDWAGQITTVNKNYLENRKKLPNVPCRRLWFDLSILSNGLVSLCCLDYEGKIILGDVNKQSIYEIWNGEKFEKIRYLHLTNQKNKIELCRNCNEHVSWWRSDDQ